MTEQAPLDNLFRPPETFNFRDAAAALIVLDDGRYLMQLRDDKPGIFYPNHWGLFGGASEAGEAAEDALRRELREELGFDAAEVSYFTKIDFAFDSIGASKTERVFFEVPMPATAVPGLILTEGRAVEAVPVEELLLRRAVVPYDAFAIWMHTCLQRGAWGGRSHSSRAKKPS